MTKQEILQFENMNTDAIVLFLEGSFWIAYERSAFRFVRMVRPYKVKKKWVNCAGAEIASLGFPVPALDGIVAGAGLEIVTRDERRVSLRVPETLSDDGFDDWKESLETFIPAPKHSRTTQPIKEIAYDESEIVRQIRTFSLESATPVQCMLFVADLRRQIAGG